MILSGPAGNFSVYCKENLEVLPDKGMAGSKDSAEKNNENLTAAKISSAMRFSNTAITLYNIFIFRHVSCEMQKLTFNILFLTM